MIQTANDQDVCSQGNIYLSSTGSVLSGTTSDQLSIVVLEKVLIETHVLFLREDGIVCLHIILLQESFVTIEIRQ